MTGRPETRPAHSPLGASSAERWISCPGSYALLRNLELPETDEPDYRREGTAMHEAAAHCLAHDLDTFEIMGDVFNETPITADLACHIQTYLDVARGSWDGAVQRWIEQPVSSPVHELFYGTLDLGALFTDRLEITDLKGGQGVIVEPDDNPQLKYYAFGLIDQMDRSETAPLADDFQVVLRIVQPRGFHPGGPVREWETTVGAIRAWIHETLVPAMNAVEVDHTLDAGEHCRFCPAKLVCPLLTSLFGAAAKHDPKTTVHLSDESLGQSYRYVPAVKMYAKALEEEVFRRLNTGHVVPGTKLVNKKANRIWKGGAEDIIRGRFGAEALTTPELKGPAEIEKMPGGKPLVSEWAYTPQTGLTVALATDVRQGLAVKPSVEVFSAAVANLG